MGAASFVQGDFRGGEWSQTAQGNIADPKYKTSMTVCLNGIPMEPGAWTRRPGTRFCATTRGGGAGRLIPFGFRQDDPYYIELTAGYMRFFDGPTLVLTNDSQTVSAISTANPASVTVGSTSAWATGNSFLFSGLGTNNPLLLNRVFTGTVVDGTHVTIADAITGATIDGSTLGAFVSGTMSRVLEYTTPYIGMDWGPVRSVQAELTAVLLQGGYAPQSLTVVTSPSATLPYATFALAAASFNDGPYFDPVQGGALLTPSASTGIINVVVSYPAYSATTVYAQGAFVTFSSVTYQSLVDQNLNNQPDTHSSQWAVVSASLAVGPNGFQGSDIGRHMRFFSEPALWAVGTSYAAASNVSYVDANGNTAYYTWTGTTTTATATNAPGLSTSWGVNAAGATWTWGRITGLLNLISGTLSGSANIGTMTQDGGLTAAFDGILSKALTASAVISDSGLVTPGSFHTTTGYVGKNYSGASTQIIQSVTVVPSTDSGLISASTAFTQHQNVTINLRAKQTSPASSSDGTLLGTYSSGDEPGGVFNPGAINIVSTDQSTAWNYAWVELIAKFQNNNASNQTLGGFIIAAQVQFFSTTGTSSAGATVELIGGNLQYNLPIRTWRLGLYSGTSGYPQCGTYHEGRLWLSGSVGNRIDGSVPVTIAPDGTIKSFSFAPTANDGTVTDASAIDYTFDAKDVNAIFWMDAEAEGIVCGTQAGEWLVRATSLNSPLTPTNIQAHRMTHVGCANIEPRRTEHALVAVQRHQRKIVEFFADVFSGKFTAPNLAEKAKHLTTPNLAELAYMQELFPCVWARLEDGGLIGMTYKRDTLMTSQGPTFNGWHRHTLGSGRTVESISVGHNDHGGLDALAMVTNDAATNIRHVEILTDLFEEGSALTGAWFLDDAISLVAYTTATGITINGLWHLNGKTVTIFAGGLDVGDWPVTNGSALVPFAPSTTQTNTLFTAAFVAAFSGAMPILAGFTYNSDGQLSRPDTIPESGARNGPGFGKLRRMHKFAAKLVDTQGISFGTRFTNNGLHAAQLKTPGGTALLAANVLFNGIYKDTMNDDAQGFASQLCWRISRPFPATVAAMGGFLETVDE